jgi:hypothetical protein
MAINITQAIQQNLGVPELQKIDPNTQEVKRPENISSENYIWQAAIPTVLLGLYKFSGDEKKCNVIINGSPLSSNLLDDIFDTKKEQVIEKVATYTGNTNEYTAEKMEQIASEAVRLINENISKETTDKSVRRFLIDQRNNILPYLPAALQIGNVLGDDTIDDRSNKMEGPMSSHMHWLEKFFPSTDRKKEENW